LKTFVASLALLLAGCATKPIVLPPEIIKVPVYMPLPSECSKKALVDLPPGSTAVDVMAKQKKAIDELEAQVQRCFRSAGPEVL
jgi:starvation-inducible outer membrane lipoprotein